MATATKCWMRPGEPGEPGWNKEHRGWDREWILTFFFPSSSSFDNSHLCSGGGDKTVVLWDVATGQVVRKFRGHAGVSTSQKTLINVCIVESQISA